MLYLLFSDNLAVVFDIPEIESIFTEINFKDKKWLICGLYRPPSMKADKFIEDFTNTFDKASLNYENVLVLGDLNYNMQDRKIIATTISM
jgi:hypothetical protein